VVRKREEERKHTTPGCRVGGIKAVRGSSIENFNVLARKIFEEKGGNQQIARH